MKMTWNMTLMQLLVNYLGDLTDLSVTSFSGSYIVDGFEIGIDISSNSSTFTWKL